LGSQGVIGTFLKQIMQGQPIKIWGDGSVIRDYIYIADVVSVCMKVIESGAQGVFNVGSGVGYSLLDIIQVIEECTQQNAELIFEPKRGFDVQKVVLDTSRAQEKLNWSLKYSLKQGVKNHYDWLKPSVNMIS